MQFFGIIYLIINKINGKMYVGQTTRSLHVRWLEHCSSPKRCPYLYNAIKYYGKDNFTIEEVVECKSLEEMNYREPFYIKSLNTLAPNGYNLKPGGNNKRQHVSSKKKIAKTMLGVPKSEEHKKNMSIAKAGENSPNFGKHYSKEHKKNMSLNHADVSGENAPMVKLTWLKVKEIRDLYLTNNYTHRRLGEMFGVCHINIGDIVNNKIWVVK